MCSSFNSFRGIQLSYNFWVSDPALTDDKFIAEDGSTAAELVSNRVACKGPHVVGPDKNISKTKFFTNSEDPVRYHTQPIWNLSDFMSPRVRVMVVGSHMQWALSQWSLLSPLNYTSARSMSKNQFTLEEYSTSHQSEWCPGKKSLGYWNSPDIWKT